MQFYSQIGQDEWVCQFFRYKRDGFFVDVGAYDGVTISNTYYLEQELGWKGICVEAGKMNYSRLIKERNCLTVCKAVYHTSNLRIRFREGRVGGHITDKGRNWVTTISMADLLNKCKAPKMIDYISIDIEGGELDALAGFPFDRYQVGVWTIEHQSCFVGEKRKKAIQEVMFQNGYVIAKEDQGDEVNKFEDWFINKEYEYGRNNM